MEQYLGFFLALGIMATYLIVANFTFKPNYYLDRQKTWITDKSPERVAMVLQHMLKTELALDVSSDNPYWQDMTESFSNEGMLLQAKLTVKSVSVSGEPGTAYYSILLSVHIKYVDNKTIVRADYKTKGYDLFFAPEMDRIILQPLIDKNKTDIGRYLNLP